MRTPCSIRRGRARVGRRQPERLAVYVSVSDSAPAFPTGSARASSDVVQLEPSRGPRGTGLGLRSRSRIDEATKGRSVWNRRGRPAAVLRCTSSRRLTFRRTRISATPVYSRYAVRIESAHRDGSLYYAKNCTRDARTVEWLGDGVVLAAVEELTTAATQAHPANGTEFIAYFSCARLLPLAAGSCEPRANRFVRACSPRP